MRIARVAALLSLVLTARQVTATSDEVVLSLRPTGAVRVPVVVNGQGPFSFLLDTGSSHTTLSSALADRLALPLVAKVRVTTPAGVQTQPVVEVEHMAIGSASVSSLRPSVVSLAELDAMERGVQGVIGQDFLKAFDYTIDYRRKRLRWTAEPADAQARLPLVRAGERSLVELTGNKGEGPVLMVPDSGSEGFVIFERNGRTAVIVDPLGPLASVSALSMRQVARGAVLRELKLGALTLRDQPAVVVAREGSGAVEADGLMPLHQFSSVSFNNSEAYLAIRR